MILDSLKNAALYAGLGKNFADAFAWIKATDLAALPTGKTVIDGTRLYASVQDYITKPKRELRWEAHRRYVDIQVVVSGFEKIGVTPVETLEPDGDYNTEADCGFFKGRFSRAMGHNVETGGFAILFPHEAHAPGLQQTLKSRVHKVVIKVAAA